MNNNHLIIMAGGIGSRFWPMSTPDKPKQFIDVLGCGKSLIQLTAGRFSSLIPSENIWIVTSKAYKSIVREQLADIPEEQILLEPCMRNTAPCIAYVAWKIKARYPNANLVFSPADHIVLNTSEFHKVLANGLAFSAVHNSILTLGMKANRPETGYGYIKADKEIKQTFNINGTDTPIRKVEAFKEKPCLEIAKQYLKEGVYYWNSGLFLWNVKTLESEMRRHCPELAIIFDNISEFFYSQEEQYIIDKKFPECENISIDYAVMEHSENVYVYPADFSWSDLGTWGSLYTHLNKDDNDNASVGNNIRMMDCRNCIVHTPSEKKVVIQGLDSYIVAEHEDTLLICKLEDEQNIKQWSSDI